MIDEKKGIIRIDSHIWYLEDDIYNEYIKKNNIKNTNALACLIFQFIMKTKTRIIHMTL